MDLNLDPFTYITGIAGILGLFLQFKDSFKEHRETRNGIVFVVLGIFIGSLVTSVRGVKIDFGGASISPFQALVAVLVAILAVVALTGAFAKESDRRNELFSYAGIGVLALFVLLFVGALGSGISATADRDSKQVQLEELVELATLQDSRGNYDRAILLLTEAKARLLSSDTERQKLLDARIHEIERKQVGR